MNWKGVGQAAGAAGVILSLLFVGLEVRQNTAVARNDAYQQMVAGFTDFHLVMATDEYLARLWARVAAGAPPSEFDTVERLKLRSSFVVLVRQWEGVYRSVQQGVLPGNVLQTVGAGGLPRTPVFQDVWPTMRGVFTEDFVSFFESSAMSPN